MSDLGERLKRASEMLPQPQDDPFERLTRRRDQKRRNERVMAATVSLVLVGGILVGTLAVFRHVGVARGSALGGSIGQRTGLVPPLGDGSFVYRTQTLTAQAASTAGSTTLEQLSFTITTWWANDGSGRFEFTCITPDCSASYGFPKTGVFEAGNFPTDDDVTGLSGDPSVLLAQLEERSGPDGNSPEPAFSPGPELAPGVTVGTVLDAVVNILEDPNGSPELKAACYDVAKSLPTVEATDGVTDPTGRPAVRLRFDMNTWGSVDYYFDPTTHLLMAEVGGGVGTGEQGSTTIYNEGIVGSTDATPAADQWLFPMAAAPTPSP